jgi:hypothetical protein
MSPTKNEHANREHGCACTDRPGHKDRAERFESPRISKGLRGQTLRVQIEAGIAKARKA